MHSQTSASDLDFGITTIDAGYVRPGIAAMHMMIEDGRAAFFDTGTSRSLPTVLDVLARRGLTPDDVRYVVPTHVHLDHAGGAGAMMRAFDNAELIIHPRGARHMIDPTQLVAGTVGVYGEQKTHALYGDILPVDERRVIVADDGFELDFCGRPLRFIDTPGHARHHFCVVDEQHRGIFTGDTMGISYRVFDSADGPFLFPTTTPVQFDPDALHDSVRRLMATDPRYLYLTHFGRITPTQRLIDDLHRQIDAFVEIARSVAGETDPQTVLEARIGDYMFAEARRRRPPLDDDAIRRELAMDVALNAQGIWVWLEREQR